MKKLWKQIKIKVLLGYFFLVVIVSFTIWIVYAEIIQLSINKTDIAPLNKKVIYINEVLANLYQAEGLERSYLQTGNMKHYRSYTYLMDTIYLQIDTLSDMSENPIQLLYTDSIRSLILEKRKNLRELVAIKKTGSSEDLYRRAMMRLMSNKDTINNLLSVYKTVITNRDTVFIKQKKKKLLDRLIYVFSPQENQDTTLQINVSQSVVIDSMLNNFNPADSVTHFLTAMMEDIRKESVEIGWQLVKKEQEVLENDRTIMLQLRQILSTFENEEFARSYQELKELEQRIRQTTWLFIILGTLAIVVIVVFLVLISKDISKSQRYRLELEKAKAYSDSLLKSKEQFMLSITHDLKSPLSSIIGYAQLMNKTTNTEQNDYYLENINKMSDHILKLINDLVDLTRLESGKLKIEHIRFDLKSLVDETISAFYPIALSKNLGLKIKYNVSQNAGYRSDPVRIKQILGNLISNALKFTDHGEVELNVSLIESFSNTDRIRFEVRDTGIGISNTDKELIFNEFSRVVNKNNKQYEGAGLGLTISKKIVSLLGGTIALKSRPGEGSRFTVILPLQRSNTKPPVNSVSTLLENSKLEGKRVLLIDDDSTFLNMTAETLQKSQMKIHKCNNPEDVLQILEQNSFDLIMTDIQMPKMSGIELFTRMKNKIGADVPVIAITGQDSTNQENLMKIGFAACIYKPFLPKLMLENINKVLTGESLPQKTEKAGISKRNTVNSYSLNQIEQFAMGDQQSVKRILISFIETNSKNIVLFSEYLREKDYNSLSELAHKMLSMFRQLEAKKVIGPLSKIEKVGNKQLTHEQLTDLCNNALGSIKQLIDLISEEQDITVKT